jgi:hypothetical protein
MTARSPFFKAIDPYPYNAGKEQTKRTLTPNSEIEEEERKADIVASHSPQPCQG